MVKEILTKEDYVLMSLSKIKNKRWEHYVVNRIYHRLNDLDIEFVCQQCIRKNGRFYMADLYFPQFDVYLEIDERHHETEKAKIDDAQRRFDIADATNLNEYRISTINSDLDRIHEEIEVFVERLEKLKANHRKFVAWDYDQRFSPEVHRRAGSIEIGPRSAFRHQKDALACFGYEKGHYQRAVWKIPENNCNILGLKKGSIVWFPKLFEQKNWKNSLSQDGTIISELNKRTERSYVSGPESRIFMAHSLDPLKRIIYKFIGVFEVIPAYNGEGENPHERRYRRVATRIPTVPLSS